MEMIQRSKDDGTIVLCAVSEKRHTLSKDEEEQLASAIRSCVPGGWTCSAKHETSRVERGEFAGNQQVTLVVTPPSTCCHTNACKMLRAARFKTS